MLFTRVNKVIVMIFFRFIAIIQGRRAGTPRDNFGAIAVKDLAVIKNYFVTLLLIQFFNLPFREITVFFKLIERRAELALDLGNMLVLPDVEHLAELIIRL